LDFISTHFSRVKYQFKVGYVYIRCLKLAGGLGRKGGCSGNDFNFIAGKGFRENDVLSWITGPCLRSQGAGIWNVISYSKFPAFPDSIL
jgi:hypothetical protein